MLGPLLDRLQDNFTYKSSVSKIRWLHTLSFAQGGERYAAATTYFRFDRAGLADLYEQPLLAELSEIDPCEAIVTAFDSTECDTVLDRMLHSDASTRLPEHLLILFDRMTMAHSLEGRSPMLDHRIAEFAGRLPVNMKIKGRRLKYLLRKVAARYVPDEVTRAPKQGFMFPIAYWLKDELHGAVRHVLIEESRFVERGWFRAETVERLLREHASGQKVHHHRIWMLLNLEVWHRLFLDGRAVQDVSEELRNALATT